jgi:hypothetical protein
VPRAKITGAVTLDSAPKNQWVGKAYVSSHPVCPKSRPFVQIVLIKMSRHFVVTARLSSQPANGHSRYAPDRAPFVESESHVNPPPAQLWPPFEISNFKFEIGRRPCALAYQIRLTPWTQLTKLTHSIFAPARSRPFSAIRPKQLTQVTHFIFAGAHFSRQARQHLTGRSIYVEMAVIAPSCKRLLE